jgi:regulator of cell morphogenesis and NO signaling
VVLGQLRAVERSPDPPCDVSSWPVEHVIERIVGRHHAHVRKRIPMIDAYFERMTARHAEQHPELRRITSVFTDVASTLVRHMQRQELILFPYIQDLASAGRTGDAPPEPPFGTVMNPIGVMEEEHRTAAAGLRLLRVLTEDYHPPKDACATWRVCYEVLDEFDRDLQQHVHLENSVVFPAALRLEQGLLSPVLARADRLRADVQGR